jgi:metal-responsive CopG/Arc/MetJ family transcriptional regulator
MKVLVELDEEMARKLEEVAPARSRLRSEFIRAALRRALWDREEEATRRAYEQEPDSEPAHFDPDVWESA